jgi:hypothetical protein
VKGNKYEASLAEVRSVLDEWIVHRVEGVEEAIVERLIEKGVIQSTDPDDLGYRTGPLEPGRKIVGGERTRAERFEEAKEWTLTEHAETLRRLGGLSDEDLIPDHPPTPGSVQRNVDGDPS